MFNSNEEICIQTDGLCIQTDGLCIKTDEVCIQTDGLCIKTDGFCIQIDESWQVRLKCSRCWDALGSAKTPKMSISMIALGLF